MVVQSLRFWQHTLLGQFDAPSDIRRLAPHVFPKSTKIPSNMFARHFQCLKSHIKSEAIPDITIFMGGIQTIPSHGRSMMVYGSSPGRALGHGQVVLDQIFARDTEVHGVPEPAGAWDVFTKYSIYPVVN